MYRFWVYGSYSSSKGHDDRADIHGVDELLEKPPENVLVVLIVGVTSGTPFRSYVFLRFCALHDNIIAYNEV